ncbi:MAG TPA: thioredoxin [Candidatus Aquicultor sp.]|jgi:thioredoxin 1
MASEKITNISDAEFDAEVLKADKPVIVDFWAPWCGPCKLVAPRLEEIADEYDGKLKVIKVNVDDNQEWAGKLGVMSIPTLLFFKDGDVAGKIVGAVPKEEIIKRFGL